MIEGRVVNVEEAIIPLTLETPAGLHEIEAVIDTGNSGSVTLPRFLVEKFKLPLDSIGRGQLADGSIVRLSIFEANIRWHGKIRNIKVVLAEATPTIGMSLLLGDRLTIDVCKNGRVTIEPLESL